MTTLRDYETREENTEPNDGDAIAEAVRAVAELRSTAERARSEQADALRAMTTRLDAIEVRMNRPNIQRTNEDVDERRAAFRAYLQFGVNISAEQVRALTASNLPTGGYLAPPEFVSEFLRDLVELSPIRGLASVRTTGQPSVIYPRRTSGTNATWRGETQTKTESGVTFGQVEIPVREVNTFVDVSNILLADSGGAAEAEVRMALSEDFAYKEGKAFVDGIGPLAPEGILSAPGVGYKFTGNASTLGTNPADLLIDLLYSLPAAYRARSTWLMNGTTLAAVRKLKDGTTGTYLWQPAYAAGQPETILGRPVVEAPDMPDVGTGAEPIVLGDIGTAFRIIDRETLTILVDPYSLAVNSMTRIHATRRVGSAVVQPAALKKIRCATS